MTLSSQQTTVAPCQTSCSVSESGDFPSLPPLSAGFIDLYTANLNRIYSPHVETNMTLLLQRKERLPGMHKVQRHLKAFHIQ